MCICYQHVLCHYTDCGCMCWQCAHLGMADLKRRMGKVIRRLREQTGVGQERFAHNVGLHRTTMGRIEKGEYDLALSTLESVAKGLGISVSELLAQAEDEGRRKKSPQ